MFADFVRSVITQEHHHHDWHGEFTQPKEIKRYPIDNTFKIIGKKFTVHIIRDVAMRGKTHRRRMAVRRNFAKWKSGRQKTGFVITVRVGPKGHGKTVIAKPAPYFFPSKNFLSMESL